MIAETEDAERVPFVLELPSSCSFTKLDCHHVAAMQFLQRYQWLPKWLYEYNSTPRFIPTAC